MQCNASRAKMDSFEFPPKQPVDTSALESLPRQSGPSFGGQQRRQLRSLTDSTQQQPARRSSSIKTTLVDSKNGFLSNAKDLAAQHVIRTIFQTFVGSADAKLAYLLTYRLVLQFIHSLYAIQANSIHV